MSLRLYVALAVLFVSLGGCAARPLAVDASRLPNSLAGVNGLTADRTVIVELVNGGRVPIAENLVVTRDDVRFTVDGTPRALPTEAVRRVLQTPERATRRGAAGGAVPGALLAGLGLAGLGAARAGESECGACVVPIFALAVGGATAAAVGAGVGGVVGSRVQTEPARVLYEGPVERYRDAGERRP